ncbi:MAG: exo-beta-N-acetylmuramidase NamZ family protein, partial [Marinirhabdus sp.]
MLPALFSCGSGHNGTTKIEEGTLGRIIETGKAITEDHERGQKRKEGRAAKNEATTIIEVGRLEQVNATENEVVTGAEQPESYLPLLRGKKVGVVSNQASVGMFAQPVHPPNGSPPSVVRSMHLVDYLLGQGIMLQAVFAPEHGFRGTADAGEAITDGTDAKTGLPVISLYGKNKKPSPAAIEGIDVMVFDIQDVGARFYTYISTLHYVMEACAEAGIPLVLLDRPNPNGHYTDGPILEPEHRSFVGMHPVPVVHGMTMGEYAQMINGEGWLSKKVKCKLSIIKLKNYTHGTPYSLPVKPSPNLPNATAVALYPSLCFFEGTIVSAGRGTGMQFQVFGAPQLPGEFFPFSFTPRSREGAKHPKFKGEVCHGTDLRGQP